MPELGVPGVPLASRSVNPIPTRGRGTDFATGTPKFFHLLASMDLQVPLDNNVFFLNMTFMIITYFSFDDAGSNDKRQDFRIFEKDE